MTDGVIQESETGFGKEQLPDWKPCVVLAVIHGAEQVSRQFRLRGWDPYIAESGPQLRRLVRLLEADLAVLDVALDEESGWLTCAKLREEWPAGRIVLLGRDGARRRRLAAFAGADALVPREEAGLAVMQMARAA